MSKVKPNASRPDSGFHGVPPEKAARSSQVSRPGEFRGPSARLAGKKLNPNQAKAHGYNTRSENGNADPRGGN